MEIDINYLGFALGWLAYFSLHSLFSRKETKAFIFKIFGFRRSYRLTYNIWSTLGLVLMLRWNFRFQQDSLIETNTGIKALALAIALVGIFFLVQSFRAYSTLEFLGLKEESQSGLRKSGILRYVRHPIYTGTILILIAFWMLNPTIASTITCVTTFLYLPIGIWFEEKDLVKEFGEKYKNYKKEVPGITPRVWK